MLFTVEATASTVAVYISIPYYKYDEMITFD